MFHAVKTDSLYAANAPKIQLVANGWQWVPWFSEQTLANVPDADAIDVSAYTAGPNTSMPMTQTIGGVLSMQAAEDANDYPSTIFGKKVYVYEEAPGVLGGSLTPNMESIYATSL